MRKFTKILLCAAAVLLIAPGPASFAGETGPKEEIPVLEKGEEAGPGSFAENGDGSVSPREISSGKAVLKVVSGPGKNIEDVSLTLKDFSEPEEKTSFLKLENKGKVLEKVSITGNGVYGFKSRKLPEGKYAISYRIEEKSGGVKEETKFLYIDGKAPVIEISDIPGLSKEASVFGSIKDEHLDEESTEIKVTRNGKKTDGLNIKKTEGLITFEGTYRRAGSYKIIITAADLAGNTAKEVSREFVVDDKGPGISLINTLKNKDGEEDGHVQNASQLKILIKDENFKKGDVIIYDDRGRVVRSRQVGPPEHEFYLPETGSEGAFRLYIATEDEAGNVSDKSINIICDSRPPDIVFSGIEDNGFYNTDKKPVTRYEDAFLDAKTVKYSVEKDGEAFISSPKTEESPGLIETEDSFTEEGSYRIKTSVSDLSLNKREEKTGFTIDKTPPRPVISGIGKGGYVKSLSEISLEAEDRSPKDIAYEIESKGKILLSGKEAGKKTFAEKLPDGKYKVKLTAADLAGNTASSEEEFTIDSTAPVITLGGATKGRYYNKNITLAVRVKETNYKDNSVKVNITKTLRGKSYNIPFTFRSAGAVSVSKKTLPGPGTYKVKVTGVDMAGNAAAPKSLEFTVDKKAPEIKVTGLKAVYGQKEEVNIKAKIEDDYLDKTSAALAKKKNRISGKAKKTAYSHSYAFTKIEKLRKNDGSYRLEITAKDRAGNTKTFRKSFKVNRYGSRFAFLKRPESAGREISEAIKIREKNLSEITEYKASVIKDGLPRDAEVKRKKDIYTFSAENFREDGVYKIDITSKDAAGNTSQLIKSKGCDYKFIVDSREPSLFLEGIKKGDVFRQPSKDVYINASDNLSGIESIRGSADGRGLSVKEDERGSYITLPSGYNMDVSVTARDNAGNEKTFTAENITVATGPLALIMQHKILSGALLFAGLLVLLAAARIRRRRRGFAEEFSDEE